MGISKICFLLLFLWFHFISVSPTLLLSSFPVPLCWFKYVNILYQVLLKSSWSGSFTKLMNLSLLWCIVYLILWGPSYFCYTLILEKYRFHAPFGQPLYFRRGFLFVILTVAILCSSWDIPIMDESGVPRKMIGKTLQEIWGCWWI